MGTHDQRKLAPPGQMVDVGGFRLHAVACGQGTPTVLLEPALGGFALQYAHIQSALSTFTRVVAYDRAGQGWSDVSPNPRTPSCSTGELRALLGALDIQPPYVLAGHSFGGLLALIYAGCHPEEVAGIVLVDSTHPDEYDAFPDIDKIIGQMALGVRIRKFASRVGLGRQLSRLGLASSAKSLSKEDLDSWIEIASQPKDQDTLLAEFSQHRHYYGSQSEVPRSVGDIPLTVVTAGKSISGPGRIGGLTGDQMNALHQGLQQNLVRLSSQGEQIILPDANHLSILTEPECVAAVVDAIRHVVERVRREPPHQPLATS